MVAPLAEHLPSTGTDEDQSLVVAPMARDLCEGVCDAELIFYRNFEIGRSLHGANRALQEGLQGFNQVLIDIQVPNSTHFLINRL